MLQREREREYIFLVYVTILSRKIKIEFAMKPQLFCNTLKNVYALGFEMFVYN